MAPRAPERPKEEAPNLRDFDEIRRIVIADPGLMSALTPAATERGLFAAVIALGRERGIAIAEAELAEIVRANRRAWLERWIPL
jgi:hypothetical protein